MPSSPVLANRAYELLRDSIVRGELRPNQRLVEAEVCERIGIGRSPVRNALSALADQGFILKQRTSWTVREFGVHDIINVYETRMALEGYAARLTAERATDLELGAIEKILDSKESLEFLPPDEQVELNDAFHGSICGASGNEHLMQTIERNRQFAFDHNAARLWTPEDYRIGHQGHRDIAAALLARQADKAEELVRDHYQTSLKTFLAHLSGPRR
jgi:DNA-binding GntR family transcriptional regulator